MKTLYESILDIDMDKKDEDGAQALKRYRTATKKRYEMAFPKGKSKYDFDKNLLKSNAPLVICASRTGEGASVRYDIPYTTKRPLLIDYDKEHATFNCPLCVEIEAIEEGFVYTDINHVHQYISFTHGFPRQLSEPVLNGFFNKVSLKNKIINLSEFYEPGDLDISIFKETNGIVIHCPHIYTTQKQKKEALSIIRRVSSKKILLRGFINEPITTKMLHSFGVKELIKNNPNTEIYFQPTGSNKIYYIQELNGEIDFNEVFDGDWKLLTSYYQH